MASTSFRDVALALGLESGATAEQVLGAVQALQARALAADEKAAAALRGLRSGHEPGTCLALCRISAGEQKIEPGDALPFDPQNPPPGFDGFEEGVHYRRVA